MRSERGEAEAPLRDLDPRGILDVLSGVVCAGAAAARAVAALGVRASLLVVGVKSAWAS